MTELELRQQVVDVMRGWIGATKGSAKHQEILRIYNTHRPLARGYTVQPGDAYCATTASAAYIQVGIADYTGTECGVGPWVTIAEKLGIWIENDAYIPKPGDAIIYDWEDSGTGDNGGYPDHIGIVEIVHPDGSFDVIEGNMSGGRTGRRTMHVNGKYIRGFIAPNFAKIAAAISGEEEDEMKEEEVKKLIAARKPTRAEIMEATGDQWIGKFTDLPPWAKKEVRELIEMGAIKGTKLGKTVEETEINASLNSYIRTCIVALRVAKKVIGDAPKDALAAQMERVVEFLRGETK